ncbi:6-aminohexanoate-dimer hydrolase [Anaerolineae bacterium]|nr:6-aminohexanoate-dimer hydrolase [Anaerolineae bacterium]
MKRLLTVFVILMLVSSVMPIAAVGDAPFPTKDWAVSTPEEQGMDSVEIANYIKTFSDPAYNFDSLLVVRHGYVVAEAYSAPVQKDIPHEMYSASKSVLSAVVGIAIDQGHIKSLDDKLLSYFPDITPAHMDERKAAITIRDTLKNCSGLECNMYTNPEVDAVVMEGEPQKCLDIPMAYKPGEQWQYCQCNLFLLASVVARTTGMDVLSYANKYLFEPLGIKNAYWAPLGNAVMGFTGLRLTTRDMARIGYLYLKNGQWEGKQIISSQFVKDSISGLVTTPFAGTTYGYMWWTVDGMDAALALGYGGQYIMIVPSKDLVLVLTTGAHDMLRLMVHVTPFIMQGMQLKTEEAALPANPEGVKQLKALETELANPKAVPIKELPAIASAINKQNYAMVQPMALVSHGFLDPATSMKALSFTFEGADQFTLTLTKADDQLVNIAVGLDGLYRVSDYLTWQVAAKAEWLTPADLRIHIKYLGDAVLERIDMHFTAGTISGTVYQMAGPVGAWGDVSSFAAMLVVAQ